MADSVNISGQSNIIQFKVPECKLSEDLGNLFDNEKFSDVTLSVGGREFQAHKAILAGKNKTTFKKLFFKTILMIFFNLFLFSTHSTKSCVCRHV